MQVCCLPAPLLFLFTCHLTKHEAQPPVFLFSLTALQEFPSLFSSFRRVTFDHLASKKLCSISQVPEIDTTEVQGARPTYYKQDRHVSHSNEVFRAAGPEPSWD
ncbi:hypothetical protein BKA61DRAFT_235485 [Leptodontidium sp. MPI-SDFR-AT-0119]|nr:hypothetical protein BKA61DRAFT_235485 [Leptodontidium sp. MPI-SDFR-AT-0119]